MTTYGTVDELKIRINITKTLTTAQTAMLNEILEAVSRCIDRICRREGNGFLADAVASARYFTSDGGTSLRVPECVEITEVAVKSSLSAITYTAWTTPTTPMAGDGDWIPCTGDPDWPRYDQLPYTLIILDVNADYSTFLAGDGPPVIKITARWGLSTTVPTDIREACLMQSARWYKRYAGSMAKSLATGELGQILYRKGLDSSVRVILEDGGWIVPLYGGY